MVVSSPSRTTATMACGRRAASRPRRSPGWRRFVDAAARPASSCCPRQAMGGAGRPDGSAYDEARISYHSEMVVVATSAVRQVAHQGRLLTLLNRREISARRGLIVSGRDHRQDHRPQAARPHPRADGPARYPGQRPDPGRLRHHPAQGLAAQARPWSSPGSSACPRSGAAYNTTDIADAVCQVLIDGPRATWCWSTKSTT